MEMVDQQYLNYRRGCLKQNAQQAQQHLKKYPKGNVNILSNVDEMQLTKEVFKEVLSARQFARCQFIHK
jgi:hypothetical protein